MLRAILAAAMLIALSLPAEARPRRHYHRAVSVAPACSGVDVMRPCQRHDVAWPRASSAISANGYGPRPRAWCGWWMRQHLGVSNPAGNVARWWARYGSNAGGPRVGAIVVWNHHVGIITGGSSGAFVVKSGNDGNAVRERVLPLGRAIAFRWPA